MNNRPVTSMVRQHSPPIGARSGLRGQPKPPSSNMSQLEEACRSYKTTGSRSEPGVQVSYEGVDLVPGGCLVAKVTSNFYQINMNRQEYYVRYSNHDHAARESIEHRLRPNDQLTHLFDYYRNDTGSYAYQKFETVRYQHHPQLRERQTDCMQFSRVAGVTACDTLVESRVATTGIVTHFEFTGYKEINQNISFDVLKARWSDCPQVIRFESGYMFHTKVSALRVERYGNGSCLHIKNLSTGDIGNFTSLSQNFDSTASTEMNSKPIAERFLVFGLGFVLGLAVAFQALRWVRRWNPALTKAD